MTPKGIAVCLALLLVTWALTYFGFSRFFENANRNALPYDTYLFASSLISSALVALRYPESQYLSAVSCLIGVAMYVVICIEDVAQLNYFFISLYNLYMVSRIAIAWTKKAIQTKKDG